MCEHFKACESRFDNIDDALEKLNNRLFIDNDPPAMATRIDRTERFIKAVIWSLAPLYLMVVSVAGKVLYDMIKS